MNDPRKTIRTVSVRALTGTVALLAGLAVAMMVAAATAATFTLKLARNARVTSQSGATTRGNIVVTASGFAVYLLTGDSRSHQKCTRNNGCFQFWPPVKVASARALSKSPGVTGRLGVWRHDGFLQVTLAGHPLYRFAPDTHRDWATGEGIMSFGGTWHVIRAATSSANGSPTPTPTGTGASTQTTTAGTPTQTTTTTTGTTTQTTGTTTQSTTPTTTTTTTCLYPPCY